MKFSPLIAAALLLCAAAVLFVAGVFVLAGAGWALLAAVLPCLIVGCGLLRGVLSAMTKGEAHG